MQHKQDQNDQTDVHFAKFSQKEYTGHKKHVYSVDWNCSGMKLASASSDSTIRLWNFDTSIGLEKSTELKGHTEMVDAIAWHPENSNILGSASSDKTLKLWDTRGSSSKFCIRSERTKGSNLNLAWHPDGKTVVVGNKDDALSFYDLRNAQPTKLLKFDVQVNEMQWNVTGDLLLVTTGIESKNQGPIYVLDGKNPSLPPLEILECHQGICYCIAIDKSENCKNGTNTFATGAGDALVGIWDANQFAVKETFSQLEGQIKQLSFSHDGRYLATASEDQQIDICNIAKGEVSYTLQCNATMNTVSWNPKFQMLAYAGEDKTKSSTDEGIIHFFANIS